MIKQAIIPLAGLGTRLLPLTSVFAKELLPINGKPAIEYIIDECIEAGIKEIIFIISKKMSHFENKKVVITKERAVQIVLWTTSSIGPAKDTDLKYEIPISYTKNFLRTVTGVKSFVIKKLDFVLDKIAVITIDKSIN